MRELVWTVGRYDLVPVIDFPDEEAGVAALLQVGSLGNLRSDRLNATSVTERRGRRRAGRRLIGRLIVRPLGEAGP